MFLDEKGEVKAGLSTDGILAAAVPGTVAGALALHEKYGKLSRARLLEPAIRLAKNGFPVYAHLHEAIKTRQAVLASSSAAKEIFLTKTGDPLPIGSILKQGDLAKTLEAISARGRDGFYAGWVATRLVEVEKQLGGILTEGDLRDYEVKWRPVLKGKFNGYDIATMPLPSSGGVHLLQILNMLEGQGLAKLGNGSPEAIHLTAAASQIAYADRTQYAGDSDFVKVPVEQMIDKAYAKSRVALIPRDKAVPSPEVKPGEFFEAPTKKSAGEPSQTSSFALMDAEGNALVSIQSVNGPMGSGVVVPGAGFLLNNEMDDFSIKPGQANLWGVKGNHQNAIAPRKRPLSSMTPTILLREGKPVLALGTPAGSRIITCIAETILNYVEYKLPLFESVASTRYHHQWDPDILFHETPFFDQKTQASLEKMGYKTEKIEKQAWVCKVGAIAREGSLLRGVCDTRDTGSCRGL